MGDSSHRAREDGSDPAPRRYGTAQDFDRIYLEGQSHDVADLVAQHRNERSRFHELLLSHLRDLPVKRPRVLEVGCGTAIDALIIAERIDCLACGVDLSREALNVARKVSSQFRARIDLVNGDIHQLPFEDELFHMVFSQGVVEHFDDPDPMLSEQVRVLGRKGRLAVSVPQKYTAYTAVKHHRIRKGTWPWGYENEFTHRDLSTLGRKFGLRERSVIGYGYWLHPLEPAWILRSLFNKLQKVPPFRKSRLWVRASRSYDQLWERLEHRLGHQFMRDIAIVFEKT